MMGGMEWIGPRGVGAEPYEAYAKTIPHQVFMLFQMMFAIITPALITGAFAERKKFSAFLLFTLLWATFVYDPLAHWVWGDGGWLKKMGALDFAGGTVVHISSGVSALVCALVAASGAVAGLVAITPASGYVGPISALIIGAVAGSLCYAACNFKSRLGYDDSLDVVGVHGVGGTWGALATGLFASKAINDGGADGLFFGNPGQLWTQLVAVVSTIALAVVLTWVILKVVDAIVGLRVSEEDEVAGLDLSQHSETAYALGGGQYGQVSTTTGAFADAMRAAETRPRAAH